MFENDENKDFSPADEQNMPAENFTKPQHEALQPADEPHLETAELSDLEINSKAEEAVPASGWDSAAPQTTDGQTEVNSQVYSYIEDWRRASAQPVQEEPAKPENTVPQLKDEATTVMSQRKEVYGSMAGGDVWQPVPPKAEEPLVQEQPQSNSAAEGSESANWYSYNSSGPTIIQHQPQNTVGRFYMPHETRETRKKGASKFVMVLVTVFVFSLAALAGVQIYDRILRTPISDDPSSSTSVENETGMPGLTLNDRPEEQEKPKGTVMSSSDVVKTVKSSVVGISNYYVQNSFTPDSEGSGIIFSADGFIVTNAHVIADSKILTVSLENGDTYPATVIGSDTRTDLAVIKIDAQNLPYAEFGNSDQIEVGDSVLAIGNPNGMELAGSVTKGIVSGLNRFGNLSSYGTSYIQTDAAINPGNSGGALVNEYAQVIGINSAKLVATEFEGIGFAIPINEVLPIITDLMKNGRVTGRAELGITGQMVDEALAEANGTPMGIGIKSIKPESDLLAQGVEVGDIITQVEGVEIEDFSTLSAEIASRKPGDTIKLTIYRNDNYGNGKTFEVEVALMEMVE